jgi:hypothetical protein
MNRTACVVASIAIAFTALPAAAGPGLAVLPQTPGQRQTYHVVHIVQTADGPQTTTTDFTIVRRAGTALVIERTGPGGAPNLSVLKAASDGTLALSEDAQGAAADGDLTDVLFALNLALVATREGDPSGGGSWDANLPVTATPHGPTAQLLMQPGRLAGSDFDFGGIGQTTLPISQARRSPIGISGGFPGGGGAFPGGGGVPGGRPRNRDADGDQPPVNPPGGIAVTLRVDGHAAGGRVQRVAIVQTRVITVGGVPYVNAGSWSIVTADAPGR